MHTGQSAEYESVGGRIHTVKTNAERDILRRGFPASRSPRRRVEVVVTQRENGKRQVLLQDLSFGAGVGWYVQKTIELDPDQVDALLRALCTARKPCFEGNRGAGTPVEAPRKITTEIENAGAQINGGAQITAQIIDLSLLAKR